ncbi:MAG TPA: NlpC/P60 family protein [Actinopolymorphaceae bacterium]
MAVACAATIVAVLPTSSSAEPQRSLDEVRAEVEKLEHDAELVAERSNEFGEKAKALQRRLDKLTADVRRQEKEVEAQQRAIGAVAAAEYRSGGVDGTVQLLLSENPDDFLAQIRTARALEGRRAETMRHLMAEQKRLVEQREAQAATLARLRETKQHMSAQLRKAKEKAAKAKALLEQLTEEERERLERASRGGGRTGPPPPPPTGSSRGEIALRFAIAQIGEPYVFGSSGPNSWDCSDLTMMAWRQAGVSLPHSSRKQYAQSAKISRASLRPGDLVIYYSDMHHVGMYAGKGMIVHAPRPGKSVQYDPIGAMPITGMVRPG